ncbi:hypothetical protein [Nocardia sp. 2TAF39]|uniref:hypothetical protein n=1 Tax=Nocardia sp. 2TAF39 TaxID=3233017 RepID=UPI003F9ABEAE
MRHHRTQPVPGVEDLLYVRPGRVIGDGHPAQVAQCVREPGRVSQSVELRRCQKCRIRRVGQFVERTDAFGAQHVQRPPPLRLEITRQQVVEETLRPLLLFVVVVVGARSGGQRIHHGTVGTNLQEPSVFLASQAVRRIGGIEDFRPFLGRVVDHHHAVVHVQHDSVADHPMLVRFGKGVNRDHRAAFAQLLDLFGEMLLGRDLPPLRLFLLPTGGGQGPQPLPLGIRPLGQLLRVLGGDLLLPLQPLVFRPIQPGESLM